MSSKRAFDTSVEERPYRHAAPVNCQAFDEVRIVTVPRYKTSPASGDEWRYSARTELRYKGALIAQEHYGNVEGAARDLDAFMQRAAFNDKKTKIHDEGGLCDQEGCAEQATTVYKLKKTFCRCGSASDPNSTYGVAPKPLVRQFCSAHSRRGDCALEDSDKNYQVLQGHGPQDPPDSALSPSATMIL